MLDTFNIDREAWKRAKELMAPTAPLSNIALVAQEIKEQLKREIPSDLAKQ
jgi:hypothetical protein